MNDKEYTYDIDKYTIGVDTNGEDGIGLTVAKIENGEIYFLGNCYGENARCLDLLIKENQEFKKQLEEYKNRYINRLNNQLAEGVEPDPEDYYLAEIEGKANDYDKLLKQLEERNIEYFKGAYDTHNKYYDQQQEFIKWLEDKIHTIETTYSQISGNYGLMNEKLEALKEVLRKYEKIIGGNE